MLRKLLIVTIILGLILPASGALLLAQEAPPPPPRNPDETTTQRAERLPVAVRSTLQLAQTEAPALAVGDMAAWSKLVYQSSRNGQWDIFSARSDGSGEVRLTADGIHEIEPRWTRGLTRLAYASRAPGNYDIYVMNPDGSGKTRLTTVSANDYSPSWSPDGTKIVFSSYRDGQSEVYVMNASGSDLTRLTNHPAYDGEPVWSPDGSKIAFTSTRGVDGKPGVWVMAADGHGPSAVAGCESPAWSPDQLRLACTADWNGDGWYELHVVNADGSPDWQMIGLDGGYAVDILPRSWSPDGRYVAYTRVQYIYYRGSWYWYAAYLEAFDTVNRTAFRLSNQTEEWLPDWQTSDVQKPASQVSALSAPSASPIRVSWSGADAGPSGVLGYDIQVRDGAAGTWTTWLTRTTATTANYSGIGGHTYYFRSRAWDNSHNVEDWPASPDASTTVEALPPHSAVLPLPAYERDAAQVVWSGSDPGGSGIANYSVQVRDGLAGDWTTWLTQTVATSANYEGETAHTYYFRVRATDRAQNQEAWPPGTDAPFTTFYERQITGAVYDARHLPVVGTSVEIAPAALNQITSTVSGSYAAYLLKNDAMYALRARQVGYGVAPTMTVPLTLALSQDATADHYLPPAVNLLQNGDFEAGADMLGWLRQGDPPPTATLTAHTGSYGALLRPNLEPHWGEPETIGSGGNQPDLVVASDGTVHMTYVITGGIFYTRRDVAGTWSVPELVSAVESAPAVAVTPNGDAHIVWNGGGSIAYRRKAASGAWDASTSIVPWSGNFDIAAGSNGQVHVVADGGYSQYCYNTVYYLRRSVDGQWSPPEVASCASVPRIAVGPDSVPHIVVQNAWNQGSMALCDYSAPYWGCSSLGNYSAGGARMVVDAQNAIHLLWTSWSGGYHSVKLPGQWLVDDLVPGYSGNGDLAVDSDGSVYVVATGTSGTTLQFKPAGRAWSEALPFSASVSGTPVLGVDGLNMLHVAHNASPDVLHYRRTLPYALSSVTGLSQMVSVPADIQRPTLSFLYRLGGVSAENPNGFRVSIESVSDTVSPLSSTRNTSAWDQGWIDLAPWRGQVITVTFAATATQQFNHTRLDLDEVTIGAWLTPNPLQVLPARLPVQASSLITITGDNFIAPVQVKLDDVQLPDAQWVNTTIITATAPALPFGRYDVIVINAEGQAGGLPSALLVGYETFLPVIMR